MLIGSSSSEWFAGVSKNEADVWVFKPTSTYYKHDIDAHLTHIRPLDDDVDRELVVHELDFGVSDG